MSALKTVLVVDDDGVDIRAIQRAQRKRAADLQLHFFTDGEGALRWLEAAERLPDAVILDLALPRMSGLELLTALRNDPRLAALPVCILTTSQNPPDIDRARALGIVAYLKKEGLDPSYSALFELIEGLPSPQPGA